VSRPRDASLDVGERVSGWTIHGVANPSSSPNPSATGSQRNRPRDHWQHPASQRPSLTVPAIIVDAGDNAASRFMEFFTARIRHPDTRAAYAQAVAQFLHRCDGRRLILRDIEPMAVADPLESHPGSAPTPKQHLAAIKMLFDRLVAGQTVPFNPASPGTRPQA
jgi:hypothetical protein